MIHIVHSERMRILKDEQWMEMRKYILPIYLNS